MDNVNTQLIVKLASIVNDLDTLNDLPGLWQEIVKDFVIKASLLDMEGKQDWSHTLELAASGKIYPVKSANRAKSL